VCILTVLSRKHRGDHGIVPPLPAATTYYVRTHSIHPCFFLVGAAISLSLSLSRLTCNSLLSPNTQPVYIYIYIYTIIYQLPTIEDIHARTSSQSRRQTLPLLALFFSAGEKNWERTLAYPGIFVHGGFSWICTYRTTKTFTTRV